MSLGDGLRGLPESMRDGIGVQPRLSLPQNRTYRAWGYRHIGMHSWQPHTNYESVVMSLAIGELLDGEARFG